MGPVLYPGSYVDIGASMAFSSVTYVDVDNRAAQFFEDAEGVPEIIASQGGSRTTIANFVHGDAAMASTDPSYDLSGVVTSRSGDYRVRTDNLDTYLVPKAAASTTPQSIRDRGRGSSDTRSNFAYLFSRTS